jgi:hypothetical protein
MYRKLLFSTDRFQPWALATISLRQSDRRDGIYSLEGRRPHWPNTGNYDANTMKELYGQQWVNIQYNIIQKTTITAVETNSLQ